MEHQALEALNEVYPVNITKVESVTNEMFRCMAREGIYYARITNYKSYDEQLEEVRYTNFLYNEGFGVSPTITSIHGKYVETLTIDRDVNTVLYKAASGSHLPRSQWNANVLQELGRNMGRLHRLSKKYEHMEEIRYIYDWHHNEEYAFLKYIPHVESSIREIADEVLSTIKKLPKNDSTYGLLHGDIWLENVIVDRSLKMTLVDFQDCEKHFYLFDLAVVIFSALEYSFVGSGNILDYRRSITKAIIDGYQEEYDLSPDMLRRLPLFIKLKELFEYCVMHMNWDTEKLTENQVRIMNLYRLRIESNHSIAPYFP